MTWLQWLLANFEIFLTTSTPAHCDSTGAINIAQDLVKQLNILASTISMFGLQCRIMWFPFIMSLQSCSLLIFLITKAHTRAQHSFLLPKLSVVDSP